MVLLTNAVDFLMDLDNLAGVVPEPADERQASKDDLAMWGPNACCLCSPG